MDPESTALHLAQSVRIAAVLKENAKLCAILREFAKSLEDVVDSSAPSTLPLLIEVRLVQNFMFMTYWNFETRLAASPGITVAAFVDCCGNLQSITST